MVEQQEKKEGVLKRLTKATREFIYGMVAYDTVQVALTAGVWSISSS